MIYLDTSVIVLFYLPEALSIAILELLAIEEQPALSQLVEMFSALSRRVRMREISQEQAREIAEQFQIHLDGGFYTRIPLEPIHYQQAREWIARFDTALRTLDAIHLAIAAANDLRLVTADETLAEAGNVFGITVQLITP
ncbi:type II toxin-antitoxin system VapC family toxin [Planktothrix sp. FACHB-1355]|uniref:Ribonuclease VapC n=1 Tax=Aerosakkonema funiforme FACHB-1375 TaxID=2949571 RepID=A0A926VFG5_9CYAN|nr:MULTISPECIES: type II toxin-antitoxin system VapC family toxin [Oscillatoriales]MBD2182685.1 type II toxin-antitoxin system VapC family toxin [Aerosakkonema funiforme FACHB-1375]MBD3560668.1 type II toxin-antitoxin system VapC family toxin [Planktothrix sp. FACHB-1355]